MNADRMFSAWWETYFRDEGLDSCYCAFQGLYSLPNYCGSVVGILMMNIPHVGMGHIVAVNEFGVIDPADNAPNHISLKGYILGRIPDGVVFENNWLAVRKLDRPT